MPHHRLVLSGKKKNRGTSRCRHRTRRNRVAIRTYFARFADRFFRITVRKHARARNNNYCIAILLLSLIITTELNALSAANTVMHRWRNYIRTLWWHSLNCIKNSRKLIGRSRNRVDQCSSRFDSWYRHNDIILYFSIDKIFF